VFKRVGVRQAHPRVFGKSIIKGFGRYTPRCVEGYIPSYVEGYIPSYVEGLTLKGSGKLTPGDIMREYRYLFPKCLRAPARYAGNDNFC
jgi:hypothetical protein